MKKRFFYRFYAIPVPLLYTSPYVEPPESWKFHFERPTKKRPTVFLHIAAQVMVHMHTSTEQVLQQAF